ncbi:SRPBCC domain-containing protein [Streptomyces sp. HD]|uniref:SRPBCC domain-containing protein n=1 Tax=Streptomyces sp. HD TaxID=3020892 RepID=UPI00232C7479|nr:SRPBCC domain-containing protein [Streptomyces sp. HD]MDC0767543.1 SRPBCC domain-containing protein [Streptomyces sp. HD]
MEHEVFVPVPAERLGEVLADPVRVARAVPGLQQDAGAEPVAGRLKVRVGGHTITYRGLVRLSGQDDGSYAVEGDATEARGTGSVKLSLRLRLLDADGGTTVRFEGAAAADGRVADLPQDAVGTAVTRLLNRFAENLGAAAGEQGPEGGASDEGLEEGLDEGLEESLAPGEFETRVTSDFETTPDADDAPAPGPNLSSESESESESESGSESGSEPADKASAADSPEPASVFDTDVPPPSLDPAATEDGAEEERAGQNGAGDEPPVAEAAHARRTMIGRSAEEVDHAPPRGRYAPVPAPQTVTSGSTLRWAAPAAALVLASAIVVGRRMLRRRH